MYATEEAFVLLLQEEAELEERLPLTLLGPSLENHVSGTGVHELFPSEDDATHHFHWETVLMGHLSLTHGSWESGPRSVNVA